MREFFIQYDGDQTNTHVHEADSAQETAKYVQEKENAGDYSWCTDTGFAGDGTKWKGATLVWEPTENGWICHHEESEGTIEIIERNA